MSVEVLDGILRPSGGDVSRLRSPYEVPAVAMCMAVNLGLVVCALVVVTAGWEWLESRPILAERRAELWVILGFALLALPAAFVGRHAHLVNARGNGVRVSATQLPELHEILRRECDALGMAEVPELFVSHELEEMAIAYEVGGRSSVVINADLLFNEQWRSRLDVIAFAIGHGLGALRLGHTRWWLDMLTAYAIRIPGLRTPVLEAYTFSRDRCAAFVVPGGIRALLLQAVGKELLDDADVRSFIEQARSFEGGFWAWISGLARRTTPHTCGRVRKLYDAGLFDLERDLSRFAPSGA